MNPLKAVADGMRRALDWSGRSTAPQFWWFQLFAVIAAFGFLSLMAAIDAPGMVAVVLLGLVAPNLGVMVRRLHDSGMTGALVLLALIPGIGSFVLLFLCNRRTQDGPNQYGPDPYADRRAQWRRQARRRQRKRRRTARGR